MVRHDRRARAATNQERSETPVLAALPATREIVLVVCVAIAFVLGRLMNQRKRKDR
jgi:hypothetical protein